MRTLILGGARSGKSAIAEALVDTPHCLYVATARPWPGDTDFTERIAKHVRRRPSHWQTEEHRDAIEVLCSPPAGTVLIDDLGTWLTHVFDQHDYWNHPIDDYPQLAELTAAIDAFPPDTDLIIVSPEVGMGIIPEHRAGRLFRDQIGTLNALVAQACDRVMLAIAGQTLVLKNP